MSPIQTVCVEMAIGSITAQVGNFVFASPFRYKCANDSPDFTLQDFDSARSLLFSYSIAVR